MKYILLPVHRAQTYLSRAALCICPDPTLSLFFGPKSPSQFDIKIFTYITLLHFIPNQQCHFVSTSPKVKMVTGQGGGCERSGGTGRSLHEYISFFVAVLFSLGFCKFLVFQICTQIYIITRISMDVHIAPIHVDI